MIKVEFTPEKWEDIRNTLQLTETTDYSVIKSPSEITSNVLTGEANALRAYIELKREGDAIAEALKQIQPMAIAEAEKYPEKTFKAFGATVEKRSAAATWDFSTCAAYEQAKKRLKYIEEIAKAGGGYDAETTEEIGKAIRIEGKSTIAVKL